MKFEIHKKHSYDFKSGMQLISCREEKQLCSYRPLLAVDQSVVLQTIGFVFVPAIYSDHQENLDHGSP